MKEYKELLWRTRKKARADNNYMKRLADNCIGSYEKIKKLAKEINNQNIKEKTNLELRNIFLKFMSKYNYAMAFIYLPWFIEPIFEDIIRKELRSKAKGKNLKDYYRKLINISGVYRDEEKLELLKIATNPTKSKIRTHAKKYSWIKTYIYSVKPYTEKEIKERIKELRNPSQELEKLEKDVESREQEFQKTIKELNIDKKLFEVIKDARKHVLTRDYRMRLLSETHYYIKPFIEELGKRFGLKYEEIIQCSIKDIFSMFKQKEIINERRMKHTIFYAKNKLKVYSGIELEKAKKFLRVKKKELTIIKGFIAQEGKVVGRAKIIKDIYNIGTIRKGDIIIATMTTPDFTEALEKVAAIVTDEGGITCHAAIISREMNIPCIIGTKNATKVFKDGDLVEVDANKGVIRKI
ncbi:MAG: hypothetical protein KKF65_01230 [Nanoarchaeota archaeon]|nr:hypothetical protein [Nanoarchaeota archaeon]